LSQASRTPVENITGLANLARELAGKRVELLKATAPDSARFAVLFNPGNPGNLIQLRAAEDTAKALRIDVVAVEVPANDEINALSPRSGANARMRWLSQTILFSMPFRAK
jgi:ABC-type uncharacterized transport system substrate-binding protein